MTRFVKCLAAGLTIVLALFVLLFFSLPLPGNIPVLMYHFIGDQAIAEKESNWVGRESFARQMAFLKKFNYRILTIEEYDAILAGKKKPQGREILITFDDGHRSYKKEALPVLERYGFPSTLFLVSDFVKNGGEALGIYKDSMDAQEIKKLQQHPRISFQGHTKSHPHLKELKEEELEWELVESKRELEMILGKRIAYLAYPFGELDLRVMKAAEKAGYRLAFTTSFKKLAAIPEGFFSRTRIKISNSSDTWIVFWYHISGLQQTLKSFRQKMKYGLK